MYEGRVNLMKLLIVFVIIFVIFQGRFPLQCNDSEPTKIIGNVHQDVYLNNSNKEPYFVKL